MDYLLCSMDQIKALTPIENEFTKYDDILSTCAELASTQVANYLNRSLAKAAYVETFMTPHNYGTGRPHRISLIEKPIYRTPAPVVQYDNTGTFVSPWTLTEGTDYTVDYSKGTIVFLREFTYTPSGLRVAYTGGYALGDTEDDPLQVPTSIAQATAMQAAYIAQRIIAQTLGMKSEQRDRQVRMEYGDTSVDLIAGAKMILSQYRRTLVGRS